MESGFFNDVLVLLLKKANVLKITKGRKEYTGTHRLDTLKKRCWTVGTFLYAEASNGGITS